MLTKEDLIHQLFSLNINSSNAEQDQVSSAVSQILTKAFPNKKAELEELSYTFPEKLSSTLLVSPDFSKEPVLSARISEKNLSPLTMDVMFLAFELKDKKATEKIGEFVEFLNDFNPDSFNNPPDKNQLKMLFSWFVKNVWWKISIENFNNQEHNWRVLKWTHFPDNKFINAIINEVVIKGSSTLKDLASQILCTGNLISNSEGEKLLQKFDSSFGR